MFNQVHDTIQTQPARASDRAQAIKAPRRAGWWTKRRFRTSLFLVRRVLPGFGRQPDDWLRERADTEGRSAAGGFTSPGLAKPYTSIDGGGRVGVLPITAPSRVRPANAPLEREYVSISVFSFQSVPAEA